MAYLARLDLGHGFSMRAEAEQIGLIFEWSHSANGRDIQGITSMQQSGFGSFWIRLINGTDLVQTESSRCTRLITLRVNRHSNF